jgi:hypothetical protein
VADERSVKLTIRDGALGKRIGVPATDWRLEKDHIATRFPLQPGRIYEVTYRSTDPAVAGVGLAAIRDVVSILKFGGNGASIIGDPHRFIKRVIGFGSSQSAMVLRALVYEGFNADEQGRKMLDGMLVNVAGGRRSVFGRFVQPSRTAGPLRGSSLSGTDSFPFSDLSQTDGVTRRSDGLLIRAIRDNVVPKIFYTNSSYEYWGCAASLIHTSVDGKDDVPLPETSRLYAFSGAQHGAGPFPPVRGSGQLLSNPNDYRWILRSLLGAMQRWIATGDRPPDSAYPRIQDGTLVATEKLRFPKLAGVSVPSEANAAYRVTTKGDAGKPFISLVPQVDEDGNEIAGVRMPEVQVPLATYTGWNLRSPQIGATTTLLASTGSYIPFPFQSIAGDPRKSVGERYRDREEFRKRIERSADALVGKSFLLRSDVPAIVAAALERWDKLPALQSRAAN